MDAVTRYRKLIADFEEIALRVIPDDRMTPAQLLHELAATKHKLALLTEILELMKLPEVGTAAALYEMEKESAAAQLTAFFSSGDRSTLWFPEQ